MPVFSVLTQVKSLGSRANSPRLDFNGNRVYYLEHVKASGSHPQKQFLSPGCLCGSAPCPMALSEMVLVFPQITGHLGLFLQTPLGEPCSFKPDNSSNVGFEHNPILPVGLEEKNKSMAFPAAFFQPRGSYLGFSHSKVWLPR